jgi:hypothetical protein
MKLIRYEISKALSGRFWIVILLFLLILNAVLFMEPWRSDDMIDMGKRYRADRPLLEFLYTADGEAYHEYIDELTERYGEEWQYSFAEFANDGIPGRFLPTAIQEVSVLSSCGTFMNILFPEILEDRAHIVESARRLGGVAYAEDDYYGMRLNLDIIKRYSVKPAILPALARAENEGVFWVYYQQGWKHLFNFIWGNLFAVLFTLMISSRAYPLENKAASVLYVTTKGRRHTAAAKLTASALIALTVSLLFFLINILLTGWRFGLGGMKASVLSLLQLSMGSLNMTIGQTVLLFALFQAFGVICIALVSATLSYILRSNLVSYIGSIIFLGGSYGYYLMVDKSFHAPALLRSLPDVTLWTRPMWMFETYRVVNLFSYPVKLEWICFCFWLLIVIGLYILAMIGSERGVRQR